MTMEIKHFLHVGRTGGTAIRTALEAADLDFRWHDHACRLSDIERGKDVIFFYRDPISRFKSGFYSRLREGKPRYDSPHSQGERKAFTYFKTPCQLALALAEGNRNAKQAMQNISHVNQHYSYWFKNVDYFESRLDDIYFLGRQEYLDYDFAILKRMLGMNVELPTGEVAAHKTPEELGCDLRKKALDVLLDWYEEDYKFVSKFDYVRTKYTSYPSI